MMKKLCFLMVWLFGLLLGGATFAQSYTSIFNDDFNRPDSLTVGSGRGSTTTNYTIQNNQLHITSSGLNAWTYTTLLRPTSENYLNQTASIDFKVNNNGIVNENTQICVAVRYSGIYNNYRACLNVDHWLFFIQNGNSNLIVSSGTSNDLIENHLWRITLTATGSNPTSLKASYYDLTDDTEFLVYNITDNKASNQITGQAGIMDYYGVSGSTISFDVKNFSYSAIASDEQPSLSTVHTVFPYNTPINLTVRGNTISQVSLSDDSNGTFTPSTVNLTLANNFTSTATYTPKVAGNAELIATFEDGNSVSTDVWVIPYSVKIGFIGDSLTAANQPVIATINTLDKWFISVNKGVSSSTTKDWGDDDYQWPLPDQWGRPSANAPMTTNAINDFLATGVDLVHVMLGANDVIYGVDTNQYKDNLQNLINQIKNAGIKHVILSCPTYSTTRDSVQLATHCDKIKELVAENSGYVLLGDTQAYDYFKNNISDIADGVHLTTAGYNKLGEFRADAIKSAIEYQINPVHQRSGSSSHQLTTSWTLTYSIDKRIGELTGVKVDGIFLVSGTDYNIIDSTGTLIELTETYLNTLIAGTKNLTIEFYGGVNINDAFTILSAPQCTNGATNYPACNNQTPPSGGSSWWWGGGGSSASKDNCPNGDFSPSYYDGTCGVSHSEQGEAEVKNPENSQQSVDSSLQPSVSTQNDLTDEILTAYQRAYAHDITTLAPLTDANPDWTVIRGHLAKMVTNYALNALWRTLPEKIPAQCHRKDGSNARESAEIKDYAVKACSLGLMGMDMDYFQPLLVVTRAQFGTVLSRLLRQNTYAGGKPYYAKHLQALKENWIMTQIDNPENRVELRQRVRLMLMRSAK